MDRITGGAAASAPETRLARRGRVELIDVMKGILIILVVVGHVAHPIHNDNPLLSGIFDVIYLFHMPAFIFISGLLAKGAWRDGRLAWDRIISFLALGLGFQLALLAINGDVADPRRWLRFSSAPWYIVSMAWWYAATPLLARLRPARGLAMSLAISVASGFGDFSGGTLAFARTCSFLPWFALGYYLAIDDVLALRRSRALRPVCIAAALLIAVRIADVHAFDGFFPLVYGDNPYRALPGDLVGKLIACACGLTGLLALLKLSPASSRPLAALGRRTLQVYVLHRLVRAWLTFHTPFYDMPLLADPVAGTLIILALSGAVVALCAHPALERPFAQAMRIPWTDLARRLARRLAPARRLARARRHAQTSRVDS